MKVAKIFVQLMINISISNNCSSLVIPIVAVAIRNQPFKQCKVSLKNIAYGQVLCQNNLRFKGLFKKRNLSRKYSSRHQNFRSWWNVLKKLKIENLMNRTWIFHEIKNIYLQILSFRLYFQNLTFCQWR